MYVVVLTDEVTKETKFLEYNYSTHIDAWREAMKAKEELPTSVSFIVYDVRKAWRFNFNGEYTL